MRKNRRGGSAEYFGTRRGGSAEYFAVTVQSRPGTLMRPTGSIVRPGLSGSGVGRPGLCSRRPGDPDALVRARHRLVDDRQN